MDQSENQFVSDVFDILLRLFEEIEKLSKLRQWLACYILGKGFSKAVVDLGKINKPNSLEGK